MAVPYTFGTATAAIPLSQLDSNFATTITLGNTAIQLGNTVTTLNNMTLANVTVSSGSVTLTNIAVTTANVTTANIGTAVITGTSTLTGLTASTALALDASKNIVSVTNTGSGNNVLGTSPTIATPTINTITSAASTALTLQSNNGNTAVTIDTSQNVGVGTTSPDSSNKLQVAGDFAVSWDANKFIGMKFASGTSYKMGMMLNNTTRECKVWSQSSDSDDKITFYTGSTPSERMRIDTNGNVGIGTTSPASKLDINTGSSTGTTDMITLGGLDNASTKQTYGVIQMGIENNTASSEQGNILLQTVESGTVRTRININGSGYQAFSNGGTERMRIDSSGNLLVGTTTSNGLITAQFAGLSSIGMSFNDTSNSGTTQAIVFRKNTSTQVGSIQTSTTTTSYVTSSDYRLKENVQPMTGAIAKVAALKPCTYTWKADGSAGEGFIAHELQAVVPDCVTGEKDAVDADGNPVYQGIDTSFLVATLTAAIQELSAKNDALEARLAALEAK